MGLGTCPGWASYPGDLVSKLDAKGKLTCQTYDSLHRLLTIYFYGSGGAQDTTTPSKHFVYDYQLSANQKGRLSEGYTCVPAATTCVGNILTDELFTYTARGDVATVSESTPHSNGYYTLTNTYWPNGALSTLAGIGLPTITYGLDGEGRPTTVSASSGQNPVTNTSYNVRSQVTGVTLGSGDTVTNGFDANTGRQTSYAEAVNGSTISGTLTWNSNGTLGRLVVADPFNASDVQTCNYTYDDLARIASANCGTPWSQTFTYDAFGNLTKNGSITWNPGYSAATNRYTLGGTTYDANGNLLNDTFHAYTWNVENQPVTVDAIALTYDAFGRIVEKNNSGVYNQYVYDAGGKNIATMNGQTLVKGLVPLPGGIQATYDPTNSGYRIPDWLGTIRFASNSNRTYSSSRAFAPFGERYSSGGSAPSNYTFTGMINGTVSDEYDFLARSLQTSQGRWISPDPAGLGAVNFAEPQGWNRYAYVRNNPLSLIDPLGLSESDGCRWGSGLNEWVCPVETAPKHNESANCQVGCGFYHAPSWVRYRIRHFHPLFANFGFTLGSRAPGQTWSQCMRTTVNTYSIGGAAELTVNVATGTNSNISEKTSIVTGNGITSLFFEGPGTGDFLTAASHGAGSPLTIGKRTSDIMSLNLAGKGGLPKALGSTGAKGFLETAGKWLNLGLDEAEKFAVDAGLAGAESINCAIPRVP